MKTVSGVCWKEKWRPAGERSTRVADVPGHELDGLYSGPDDLRAAGEGRGVARRGGAGATAGFLVESGLRPGGAIEAV